MAPVRASLKCRPRSRLRRQKDLKNAEKRKPKYRKRKTNWWERKPKTQLVVWVPTPRLGLHSSNWPGLSWHAKAAIGKNEKLKKKRKGKIIRIYVLPSFLAIQSLRQPASVSLSAGFVVYSKDVSLANASSPVINNKWDGTLFLMKAKLGCPTLNLEIFNSQRRRNIFSFSKISHTFRHFC